MNRNSFTAVLGALVALVLPLAAQAQSSVAEDFTKASTTNSWYFFNGACLTAGSATGVEPTLRRRAAARLHHHRQQLLQQDRR